MAGVIGINTQITEFYVSIGDTVVVKKGQSGLYKINQKNGTPFILVYYDSSNNRADIFNEGSLLFNYCTITSENSGLVLNNNIWDNELFVLTKVI